MPDEFFFEREDFDFAAFRQLRTRMIGRLFARGSTAFQAEATARINAAGFDDIRQSDNAVLINLDAEGTRITTLAQRARMTKQGMGQLVKDLERRDYVRREKDPTDGRAQLIKLTDKGWNMLQVAVGVVNGLNEEIRELVGEEDFDTAVRIMTKVVEKFDPENF